MSNTEDANTGGVVFFDLIGLVLVSYPEWLGNVINISVVIASVAITYSKMKNSFNLGALSFFRFRCGKVNESVISFLGISSSTYLYQLGYTLLVQFSAMLASFGVVTIVACILDVLGN